MNYNFVLNMLGNIKSSLVLKTVFSLIKEEKKLRLIKYFKKLQKILNISFLNYKLFTGKYIFYEDKDHGK